MLVQPLYDRRTTIVRFLVDANGFYDGRTMLVNKNDGRTTIAIFLRWLYVDTSFYEGSYE
jgi:hypothetical protein